MSALFGEQNSFLGGSGGEDDDLPVVLGSSIPEKEANGAVVLICHSCEARYALPDEIDEAQLLDLCLEMCPGCCANEHAAASGRTRHSQQAARPSRR